ncbi:putative RING-H2 finger protein ATL69 [Oryza sativa Japonica Group]|jgi:hypothetical protein|uniref:Os02g0248900 protein n=2 Tax=Oryza sativa subsp. japonica TaxID=39947 RepID=Q6K509_ORYSJ|nr:hypothetical protein DAI22_02g107700 [Oryza sativa Japonica Group]USH99666.1 zinc finger protein [Oryza sativa Japonica Group]BAD19795.1 hypothetical protein [Oryza sativa Japonica Group]BAS77896.1 Os02g0248900 [Oryza sativa Japonica Group]
MLLVNLYSRLTASTGVGVGVDDDDDDGSGGYGVLDGACGGTLAVFCALAVSVVVWKACAFVAMAAALLAIGWRVVAPRRSVGRAGAGAPTPAECGLTAAAIDALPASEYERPRGGGGDPACSVCLEDVRGGETVRWLPACGHLYHAACIDAWLRSRTTCPLCRSDLSSRRGGTASGRPRPRLVTHESLLPPLPSV